MIEKQKILDSLVFHYNLSKEHMKEAREEHKDFHECLYEGFNEAIILMARDLSLGDELENLTGAKVWGGARKLESRAFNQSYENGVNHG